MFKIAGEDAVDSGGVTREVISKTFQAIAQELPLLMAYYEETKDNTTSLRLKASGLVHAMGCMQCGFYDPIAYEQIMQLKHDPTHPYIIGSNILGLAKVSNK